MTAATAGAFLIGSVAAIPLWTLRAIRSTSVAIATEEGGGGGGATGVAEGIDAAPLSEKQQPFDLPQEQFFRFILACIQHQIGIT
jgi:hypothetical protein